MTTLGMETAADIVSRQIVAAALASAFAEPATPLARRGNQLEESLFHAAWELFADRAAESGLEFSVAAAPQLERWLALPLDRRNAAWREVIGLVSGQRCPPLESEWLPWKDTTHRSQHMADAAGFYLAFGVQPDARQAARADHIGVELDFVAYLLEKRARLAESTAPDPRAETVDHALTAFLKEHLCWWVPEFAAKVRRSAERAAAESVDPDSKSDVLLVASAATALANWCAIESALLGVSRPELAPAEPSRGTDEAADSEACGGCELAV